MPTRNLELQALTSCTPYSPDLMAGEQHRILYKQPDL